jgi:bacillithiol biosynthesis cysteine-adding enzyme BshC
MSLSIQTTPILPAEPLDIRRLAGERTSTAPLPYADALLAEGAAAEGLRRLAAGDALAVTTGQQPGLFTGPLFTLYKALTAVSVSRAAATALGRPVVPVFWVAGDDHDFRESGHTAVLGADSTVREVRGRTRPATAPQLPLYREPLGPEVRAAVEALTHGLPPTEFRDGILDWVTRHYRAENDYASAFAGALAELLGPTGLVVLRSTHVDTKRAMAPFLLAALEHAEDVEEALVAQASELAAAGRPVPVGVGDGTTLVMIEGREGRDRLRREDGRFIARRSSEAWTLDELRRLADAEPQRLSPNVLLRPVVEAALLPTLAYVGGPAELGYFPQCDPVYELLGVRPQGRVPRWSARLLEPRVTKVLEKYGITPAQLDAPEGQLEADLVKDDMPTEASEALAELRRTLDREYARLTEVAVGVDPTLQKPVQQARHQAMGGAAGVEKRLIQHLKKRNEIVVQQIAKARASLFPLGRPQERVLNIVPFLVRFGPDLVDRMLVESRKAVPPLVSGGAGA